MFYREEFMKLKNENPIHHYRSDIDGLRALAILFVIGFHLFPNIIKGGFVGVDIFFVISGYLISNIIFRELSKGIFDLLDFYARRIKRIFPALLVVLIFTFVIGWFSLFDFEFKQLSKHLIGGATFSANIIFWLESGYFDTESLTKPLLHLWSLGIEEQFYIFFPIFLLLLYKWKLDFFLFIFAVFVGSFCLNVFIVHSYRVAAFYSPFTRVRELASGSMLAYIQFNSCSDGQMNQRYNTVFDLLRRVVCHINETVNCNVKSIVGFVLVIFSLLFINPEMSFPGYWALFPTLGAFLLISAGSEAFLNKFILGNRISVFVGLISYPLYLWHWVLLSYIRIIEANLVSKEIKFGLIVLSFLFSWLTYQFIEKPVRFNSYPKHKLTAILVTLMICLIALSGITYKKNGIPVREANNSTGLLEDIKYFGNAYGTNQSCSTQLGKKLVDEEICIVKSKNPEYLITGDSHAMALNSSVVAERTNLSTILVAGHSCMPYPNIDFYVGVVRPYGNNCRRIANEALRVANEYSSIHTVILSSTLPNLNIDSFRFKLNNNSISDAEAFLIGYSDLIEKLEKLGKKVVFVIDVPYLENEPKDCIGRSFRLLSSSLPSCNVSRDSYLMSQKEYRKLIAELVQKNPKLIIFDPAKILCDEKICYGKKGNKFYYWDNNHISVSGSEYLLNDLILFLN